MDFKKFNLRSILLSSLAGVMVLIMVISKLAHGTAPVQDPQTMGSAPISAASPDQQPLPKIINDRPMEEPMEDDAQSIKDLKEQMDNDRLQQKRIKMLKLQLEQTNLQLEQEKALSEINQLRKDDVGVVDDSNDPNMEKYPDVKVIYIGGTDDKKEAILSINGIDYSVKEKNRPVKNMEVVSITNSSVVVHFNLPQDLSTTIDYKPE